MVLDVSLLPGIAPEWFAERLFDVLCADVDDLIPDAVDSVDGYDFSVG